jgi:hypothetical protein
MFLLATVQKLDTKVYNHTVTLPRIPGFFAHLQGGIRQRIASVSGNVELNLLTQCKLFLLSSVTTVMKIPRLVTISCGRIW